LSNVNNQDGVAEPDKPRSRGSNRRARARARAHVPSHPAHDLFDGLDQMKSQTTTKKKDIDSQTNQPDRRTMPKKQLMFEIKKRKQQRNEPKKRKSLDVNSRKPLWKKRRYATQRAPAIIVCEEKNEIGLGHVLYSSTNAVQAQKRNPLSFLSTSSHLGIKKKERGTLRKTAKKRRTQR